MALRELKLLQDPHPPCRDCAHFHSHRKGPSEVSNTGVVHTNDEASPSRKIYHSVFSRWLRSLVAETEMATALNNDRNINRNNFVPRQRLSIVRGQ